MLLSRKDRYNDLISVNIELAPVVCGLSLALLSVYDILVISSFHGFM